MKALPNLPLARAMQEKRRSSAATPYKNRKKYTRKDKSWQIKDH
jgi:hypothetical protein